MIQEISSWDQKQDRILAFITSILHRLETTASLGKQVKEKGCRSEWKVKPSHLKTTWLCSKS